MPPGALLRPSSQTHTARPLRSEARSSWTLLVALSLPSSGIPFRHWHQSLALTRRQVSLCQTCQQHKLNGVEKEILVALLLNELSLLKPPIDSCAGLLDLLRVPEGSMLKVVRMLSEHGRLVRSRLIGLANADGEIADWKGVVDPTLVDEILGDTGRSRRGKHIASEEAVFERIKVLTLALSAKVDALRFMWRGANNHGEVYRCTRKIEAFLEQLEQTLDHHPTWKLNAIRVKLRTDEWIIFLALLGKELGHLEADAYLFRGEGLVKAASDLDPVDVLTSLRLLSSEAALATKELVQPCGGIGDLISDDPRDLASTEFELTDKALDTVGLGRQRGKRRSGEFSVRTPTIRLDQLVLSSRLRRALDMAMAHVRHASRIIDDWGLGAIIPYGRSPVLLFWGPPGTGKTATAEAFAHALGRPILVADYSRIQNCYVGQTEKNIVRAFQEAKNQEAVLFWDEADAMFYDRDVTNYNWEVRDVNVLLQQLERFPGVCILATNRKLSLDKALERRVSMKIEFDRPDRRQRQEIWQKMLPKTMPLERNVDVDGLAAHDLVGGEIKNVVLNAARLALRRDDRGPVTMSDFRAAIQMEQEGSWGQANRSRIGF